MHNITDGNLSSYTLASDPNRVIINDLASKCGPGGSDIRINYKLNLDLRVLGVSVKPTFSDTASFECPISSSDIEVSLALASA